MSVTVLYLGGGALFSGHSVGLDVGNRPPLSGDSASQMHNADPPVMHENECFYQLSM